MNRLIGEVIESIEGLERYSDEVLIITSSGMKCKFYHKQEYCEQVSLEDFIVDDIVGGTILRAIEQDYYGGRDPHSTDISEYHTWTFYKIETTKGELWMRWLGESNGGYSESVDILVTGVLV